MQLLKGKRPIIELLEKELPEDATLAAAIDYLTYISEIEEGLAEADAGLKISHEQLLREIDEWSK